MKIVFARRPKKFCARSNKDFYRKKIVFYQSVPRYKSIAFLITPPEKKLETRPENFRLKTQNDEKI